MALPAAVRNLDFSGDGQVEPSSDTYRLLSACHDTLASLASGREFFRMGSACFKVVVASTACYATFTTTVSSLSGFRYTVPIGFQLRVSPVHRSGLFSLACS